MKFRLAAVLWLCTGTIVSADVRLPRMFSDNMILQQETSNAVWGFAAAGEKVTVTASWGAEVSTVADVEGDWKVMLPTPKFGTGHSLTVGGENTIKIENVAIGEVWLCAGQSNMGWSLGGTFGGAEEAATADAPDFRIYKSFGEYWHEPLKEARDRLGAWSPCSPKSAGGTSAVSYYFGKKLHDELGCPVGILVRAYAGTPIEGWMPKDIQADDPRTQALIAEFDKKSLPSRFPKKEEALATFEKALQEYNAKIDAGETTYKKRQNMVRLAPPKVVGAPNLGVQCPAHVYNAMIHPLRPYGIRGAIWYQCERNSKNVPQALNYRKQLALLIRHYRSTWHEESEGNVAKDFPFYFTQLPSWNPPQQNPVEGLEASWAVNREMMRLVAGKVPNTGVAVSIDTGDAILLHPQNKRPIGIRHAYLALKQAYGKDIVANGPRYQSQSVEGNRIVLHFDSIGSGLVAAKQSPLNSFAIAGVDRKWHWAEAKIVNDTVVVSSPQVSEPVAVRYAWAMNPSERNLLYNQEGIPASPFRTDDWPLFDADHDEIVQVNKPKKPDGYKAKDWERPEMNQ